MLFEITDIIILVLTSVSGVDDDNKIPAKSISKDWKFKDYIKKFRPKTVRDQIDDRRRTNGENITINDQFEIMMEGIDETDELMRLKIADIDTNVVSKDTRRQYKPTGDLVEHKSDPFELRYRIFELMKHAIYQARDRMVLMQTMRTQYRNSSVYKMGYLFSKTDTTVKTFYKVSGRAFEACTLSKNGKLTNHPLLNVIQAEERILDLWSDVQLLLDLIIINDRNLKSVCCPFNLTHHWKFVDRR